MHLQLDVPRFWSTSCIALVSACFLVFFLRKPSTPIGNSKNTYPRNTTFRLQGIPESLSEHPISKEDVIALIRKAWNIGDGAAIMIHSLATDPSDDTKKIATLSFEDPPQFISRPARKWTTFLPGEGEDSVDLALDLDFFGLTPFHREADADCTYDIVALSGLNGHAFGSFKQRGESNFMWLRDALPQHLTQAKVRARVFIYGYDSRIIKSDSFQEISDLGLEFKNKVVQLTHGSSPSGMRRLILIGHSLGGILVKQAITSLEKKTISVHEKRTFERLQGSMFFGTPSQGMDIETFLPMVDGQPNELFIRTLGSSTGILRNQMDDFRRAFEHMSFSVVWYYETSESPTARRCESGGWKMDGPKRRLVDISSATNGTPYDYWRHTVRPINRSHSEMVKFQGHTDEVYKQVVVDLKNIMSSKSVIVYSLTSEQKQFLQSLDFAGQDSRRDRIATAIDKTCDWFFHSNEFRTWINSNSAASGKGFLWVKGNPGVGKSTLMREALRRTRGDISQASTNIVSFFFNARGEEMEKMIRGLCRSLLHQILKHDLSALDYLLPGYLDKMQGRISDRVEWEEEVLKDYLSQVCQRGISIPVLIFIDALDECTDPEISRLIELFQGLVDQKKDTNASLRVCISSRHFPRPPTFGYPEITVEHHNRDDIYTYIEEELKNYKSLLELRDQIFERSSGVFLWVRLAIKQLRDEEDMYPGRPMSFLKKRLTEIPPEIGELFGSLLEKIHPAEHPRAICMFQLVLFAKERLSAGFIIAATSFRRGTGFQTIEEWAASGECINGLENQMAIITNLSGGLLEFDKDEEPTCQFIHESVRDYFVTYGGFKSLSIPQDNFRVVGWCHSGLVTSIVNYSRATLIDFTDLYWKGAFETFENSSNKKVVRRGDHHGVLWNQDNYPVKDILTHIEIAEREGFSQEASLRTLNQILVDMISVLGPHNALPDGLLHECCKRGMESFKTASRLISMEKDPRSMINKWGKFHAAYPLSLACQGGNNGPLAELLLQKGAEVNARDKESKTALIRAASYTGNPDVIQILLSYEADVQFYDHEGQTALHMAVQSENTGKLDVIQLLLLHKADVQFRDHRGETALHKAVRSSRSIKLLLSHGADPNIEDNKGQTPLIIAGFHGAFKSFLLLINAGTNVNHRTPSGETAIHNLLCFLLPLCKLRPKRETQRAFEIIQSLIENGLDLNSRNRYGNTVYDVWKSLEWYVQGDNAAYQMWKEMKWYFQPEEEGTSESDSAQSSVFLEL